MTLNNEKEGLAKATKSRMVGVSKLKEEEGGKDEGKEVSNADGDKC